MQKIDIKPIKNKKAYLQIIETFINLIITNKVEYGERLYKEIELMEILNVSRPTLREALRVMEFLEIITVSPRKGIIICNPKNNKHYFPLMCILIFEKTSNTDIFELRMAIELQMVEFATSRGTDEEFFEIKQVLDEMCNLPDGDIADFTKLDQLFHSKILSCAKNELCSKLMGTLDILIYTQLEQIHKSLTNEDRKNTIEKHCHIYQALIDRNEEAVRQAMKDHLKHAYNVTKSLPNIYLDIFKTK